MNSVPVQRPPASPKDIDQNFLTNWYASIRAPGSTVSPPANSTSAGVFGQMALDANYVYFCVKTGSTQGMATWKRIPLNPF